MVSCVVDKWNELLKTADPQEVIRWLLSEFQVRYVALSSSLGAEDQVLTDMLLKENKMARIFTLDTGRLPQETYDVMMKTMTHYGMHFEVLCPSDVEVSQLVGTFGPNLFYESVEKRKQCCQVRKIAPLTKQLSTLSAWICGLRKEQSVTRTHVQKVEWDETFGLLKVNPLADWTESQVWDYIHTNGVPYSKLHDQGYPTIGCAPCTRAVKPGEDLRAGRWWWESADQKECGLHLKDGKLVRRNV